MKLEFGLSVVIVVPLVGWVVRSWGKADGFMLFAALIVLVLVTAAGGMAWVKAHQLLRELGRS
jgi:hypothetical protein